MKTRTFLLVAVAGILVSAQKCDSKAIERQVCGEGKLVNREGVIKCEYPSPAPPTTTTTTSTSTTTTSSSTTTTTTTLPPTPAPGCSLPKMQECAAGGEAEVGIYGCCRSVGQWSQWAGPTRFEGEVEAALDAYIADRGTDVVYRNGATPEEAERLETAFVADIAARLRLRGLCVTTKRETPGGGTSDEVGIKDENGRSEQYDILHWQGYVRRKGYVAACRPSRF